MLDIEKKDGGMRYEVDIRHSVIITCFNQEGSILKAIESILNQTALPQELIVLDDHSSDATASLAEKYLSSCKLPINSKVIVNERNLGISGNMLKAAEVSSGNVISMLAGDDYYQRGAIDSINKAIKCNKLNPNEDRFVCFSSCMNILGQDNKNRISPYKIIKKSPFKTMLRKSASFVKVGFSSSALRSVDYPKNIGIWADWVWDVSICSKTTNYYELTYPAYVHVGGIGVSAKTPKIEIDKSYLLSATYILKNYKHCMDWLDWLYIIGEIYYLRGKLEGVFSTKIIGLFLFIVNLIQVHSAVMFKSNLVRYIPQRMLFAFKCKK